MDLKSAKRTKSADRIKLTKAQNLAFCRAAGVEFSKLPPAIRAKIERRLETIMSLFHRYAAETLEDLRG